MDTATTHTVTIQGTPDSYWSLSVDGDPVVAAKPINNEGWEIYGLDKWCARTGQIAIVDIEEDVLEALEGMIPEYTVAAMMAA